MRTFIYLVLGVIIWIAVMLVSIHHVRNDMTYAVHEGVPVEQPAVPRS